MQDNRVNYVMVGGFVLAMLAALLGGLAILTGRTGSTDRYFVIYDNVSGLKYGTKVLYEGFPIGQIDEIVPAREGNKTRFKVMMDVQKGWPVPRDARAQIAASGLLSAVAVDIRSPGNVQELLPPGSQVAAGPGGNVFAVMSDVANQVTDLSQNSLKPLLSTVNKQIENFGVVLQQQAPEILGNLLSLSTDLAAKGPRISSNVEQFSGRLNRVLSDGNLQNIEATMTNVAELTRELHTSRKHIDSLLQNLDSTVSGNKEQVGQALRDLRYTLQVVARNIDSVTYNLEGSSRNMNEFSRQLRDNPGVLIGGNRPGADGPQKR